VEKKKSRSTGVWKVISRGKEEQPLNCEHTHRANGSFISRTSCVRVPGPHN
jgi:hypothetical protein